MIEKRVVLPDVHLEDTRPPKAYRLVKRFIKSYRPHEIIILGDFMNVSSLSSWDLSKKRKIEGRRYVKELDNANRELDFLCKHTKSIVYLEGNHENRVERYLDDHPELEKILDIKLKLRLKERGIRWLAMNELYRVGHMYFTHGIHWGKYFAAKTVIEYGCCITVGHTHRFQVHQIHPKMQNNPLVCYGLGTLGTINPDFMNERPSGHMNQFAIMESDEKHMFNFYPINIVRNQFIYGGKKYC